MEVPGGMACKICFCPAHRVLAPRFRNLLRRTAPDWHVYGILITEALTLETLFRAAEAGRPLHPDTLANSTEGTAALYALYDLVLTWPFRAPGYPLGTYFLGDEGLRKGTVDYTETGGSGSRYDPVLRELASVFRSAGELARAERRLDEVLARLAGVVSGG